MCRLLLFCTVICLCCACSDDRPTFVYTQPIPAANAVLTITPPANGETIRIETGTLSPAQLVSYAETLKGIPYLYGSTDPAKGFDCSGFITYVFNHFHVAVPRQSLSFANVERKIELKDAKTGDLILFTGTDSTVKEVGHMGILMVKPGQVMSFLHATSGKDWGVTETPLNSHYQHRYMHTVRIFPQNDR